MPLNIDVFGLKDLQPHLPDHFFRELQLREFILPTVKTLNFELQVQSIEHQRLVNNCYRLLKLAFKLNKYSWHEDSFSHDFLVNFKKALTYFSHPYEEEQQSIIASIIQQLHILDSDPNTPVNAQTKKISVINSWLKPTPTYDFPSLRGLETNIKNFLEEVEEGNFADCMRKIIKIRDKLLALALKVICLCSNYDALTTLNILFKNKAQLLVTTKYDEPSTSKDVAASSPLRVPLPPESRLTRKLSPTLNSS